MERCDLQGLIAYGKCIKFQFCSNSTKKVLVLDSKISKTSVIMDDLIFYGAVYLFLNHQKIIECSFLFIQVDSYIGAYFNNLEDVRVSLTS